MKKKDIPKRSNTWQYIHYIEAESRRVYRAACFWLAVAVMSLLALLAISTIWTWPLAK